LSIKAGGTGLTLTHASHVIHFDRWWNPAVENQAIDRSHRIGQTEKVNVYRLISQGTIEEKQPRTIENKQTQQRQIEEQPLQPETKTNKTFIEANIFLNNFTEFVCVDEL
jgi:SNF2 family DNA or RNA helicase